MTFEFLPLIKSLGYAGVWTTLFLESGVPFFFFLPGDSLLFTVGFLASQKIFNIWVLVIGCFVSAVVGNMLGYAIGRYIGLRLFDRGDTRFLKRRHLEMTQRFYQRHGGTAIITGRFMPVIRTLVPFLAGIGLMPYRLFMIYNLIGAFVWTFGLVFFGFFFGKIFPADKIDQYLLPVIVMIIVVSFLPSLYHLYREKKYSRGESASE